MSLFDTPYYVRHRGARGGAPHPAAGGPPYGPATLNFGPGFGHPYRSSAREDRMLDHRLRNMGIYEGEEEGQRQGHQDVGPGPLSSPPSSPRSPISAAISAYSTITPERGAPLSAYSSLADPFNPYAGSANATRGREISPQELRRHQAAVGLLCDLGLTAAASELPDVPVEVPAGDDDDAAIQIVDPSNPLGARVHIEKDQYIIEAPTPGVPRERLSLEFVGLRCLELVVAPPPSSGRSTPPSEGEVLETVDVEGHAAGTTTVRRPAGARVGATPSRKRGVEELKCGVKLPADCDVTSASSTYVDGVLRVTVPRVPEGALPSGVAAGASPLIEEAREGRRKVEEARATLCELEAAVKEAEERLRDALRERGAALAEARTAVPIV
uniref:SHSP domain-containing protein n=1 Tax=Hemiselmis andersenii TaxID=464988 RepID=A0A6U2J5L2_HEMAN|mmetsp:Transcript_8686/g.20287  ORF Transcript_8686/g.20287 Transcript_8686/m.20287 type:complete len:384 (-) Transcript_8686:149-1300(-)|eukprot:CAMPEP_0114126022 /NCGR_PEP_ID=MMETSP0043_2-20121206/9608_1 /TAXON_ID=464988 /ORGANISM="Hemiselmis andersenii, Strain CCMP644" /LENGTH=383 /DNA_ID=CAMNT_0001218979 /DNA_START=33 /DNA_END=1184 /DNA_ORIENTATION=-